MRTFKGVMATDYLLEKAGNVSRRMSHIERVVEELEEGEGEFYVGEKTRENSRVYDMYKEALGAQQQLESLIRELKKGLGE